MSLEYSVRDLFGGAIQAEVPVDWIDTRYVHICSSVLSVRVIFVLHFLFSS